MLKGIRIAMLGVVCGSLAVLSLPQSWAQTSGRMEVGGAYSFVHTNAPPGDCGCFQMNGGTGWFAYNFPRGLVLVGELGGQHASNIDSTASDLTLTSFVAGPRYSRHLRNRIAPFGQLLIGGAHASGGLTPSSSGVSSSSNAFAMVVGGGVDLNVSPRWAVRLFDLDYYLTRFNNDVNDHQNNLRLNIGVVFRFGRKH